MKVLKSDDFLGGLSKIKFIGPEHVVGIYLDSEMVILENGDEYVALSAPFLEALVYTARKKLLKK